MAKRKVMMLMIAIQTSSITSQVKSVKQVIVFAASHGMLVYVKQCDDDDCSDSMVRQ